MRITFHVSDELAKELKEAARSEKKSVSSIVAEAIQFYLIEERKRKAIDKMLAIAGKGTVSDDALDELERMREEDENRF